MLWAAASLGFMLSGELTIPSAKSYDAGTHLSFQDVTVDGVHNPHILRVNLKVSKTDRFRVVVNVYVGTTGNGLCQLCFIIWWQETRAQVHSSSLRMGAPSHGQNLSSR